MKYALTYKRTMQYDLLSMQKNDYDFFLFTDLLKSV